VNTLQTIVDVECPLAKLAAASQALKQELLSDLELFYR
jgi:hypothetical protein